MEAVELLDTPTGLTSFFGCSKFFELLFVTGVELTFNLNLREDGSEVDCFPGLWDSNLVLFCCLLSSSSSRISLSDDCSCLPLFSLLSTPAAAASARPASNCPVTGFINKGRLFSNEDCEDMSRDNLEEGDSLSLETEDREDLGTGLRVTAEEEELLEEEDDDEGGGIKLAGWLPELD